MTKDYNSQLAAAVATVNRPQDVRHRETGNMLKNLHKTFDNSFPCV